MWIYLRCNAEGADEQSHRLQYDFPFSLSLFSFSTLLSQARSTAKHYHHRTLAAICTRCMISYYCVLHFALHTHRDAHTTIYIFTLRTWSNSMLAVILLIFSLFLFMIYIRMSYLFTRTAGRFDGWVRACFKTNFQNEMNLILVISSRPNAMSCYRKSVNYHIFLSLFLCLLPSGQCNGRMQGIISTENTHSCHC